MRFLWSLLSGRRLWRIWLPLAACVLPAPILALAIPLVERQLIDGVILARDPAKLPGIAMLYAGLWLISTFIAIIGAILRSHLSETLGLQLRERLFAQCARLSLAFARREHSGRTAALFNSDVPVVTGLVTTTLLSAITGLVALVGGAVIMLNLNPHLALVTAIAPPVVAGIATLITRPLRPAARQAQEKSAQLSEQLLETLAGIREMVAFGQENRQAHRFSGTLHDLMRLRMRIAYIDTAVQSGTSLFTLTVTLTIFLYGGYLVLQDRTTLGTIIAMRSLFGLVFQPAGQLIGLASGIQKALGAAERLGEFLDHVPSVTESGRARPLPVRSGAITFEEVDFAYQPERPVLQGVSFSASPGEVIALVGPSGAGKSTLASLVARFYDPTAGSIRIDGIDLRDLSLSTLRRSIGFVFQDTFLFAASIRDNLAFGDESADEAAIVAAARAAHAWEFIERLPDGLDTVVGERGTRLSEGQKQRLAIARALLRDPRILILDEPTAALDARSEHLVQEALETLMRGRTTLVIAHRLATIRRAECILVLDNGRIVERGTHAQLLQRPGLYRQLFAFQFGQAELQEDAAPHGAMVDVA